MEGSSIDEKNSSERAIYAAKNCGGNDNKVLQTH
jgi:hypothetical protein